MTKISFDRIAPNVAVVQSKTAHGQPVSVF